MFGDHRPELQTLGITSRVSPLAFLPATYTLAWHFLHFRSLSKNRTRSIISIVISRSCYGSKSLRHWKLSPTLDCWWIAVFRVSLENPVGAAHLISMNSRALYPIFESLYIKSNIRLVLYRTTSVEQTFVLDILSEKDMKGPYPGFWEGSSHGFFTVTYEYSILKQYDVGAWLATAKLAMVLSLSRDHLKLVLSISLLLASRS